MKKVLQVALAVLLIFPLVGSSCTKEESPNLSIVGYFSWPQFYIHDGGTIDIGDWEQPITGGMVVDNATVTVTNTTTGESLDLQYYEPNENHPVGFYAPGEEDFPHTAGQSVSVQISAEGNTYSGGATVTSDNFSTITAPENHEAVTQPFNLTWTIGSETTNAATHVIVYVRNFSTDPYVMQAYLLPIGTTTLQINGFDPAENYYLSVFPVTRMEISPGGGNYAYVGTTSYRSNSLMVEFTGSN